MHVSRRAFLNERLGDYVLIEDWLAVPAWHIVWGGKIKALSEHRCESASSDRLHPTVGSTWPECLHSRIAKQARHLLARRKRSKPRHSLPRASRGKLSN
jgi:hypothetical protein